MGVFLNGGLQVDVNLQLVREFFELNGFSVLTNWQQSFWRERANVGEGLPETGTQLFVDNTHPVVMGDLPTVLGAADVSGIDRAVVHVRAWHADRFYPSVIESSPVLQNFRNDRVLAVARHVFMDQPYATVLVISELPVTMDQRQRSLSLLQDAGIDCLIEFPVLLRSVLDRIGVDGNYAASPTLQTLRLLKRYRFIRNQQLEFSFPTEPPTPTHPPFVDTADAVTEDERE